MEKISQITTIKTPSVTLKVRATKKMRRQRKLRGRKTSALLRQCILKTLKTSRVFP